jgi:hypothetical protein
VNNGDGLTRFAIANCATAAIGTNYQLDTFEKSIAVARKELELVFEDVATYLIAFDESRHDESCV